MVKSNSMILKKQKKKKSSDSIAVEIAMEHDHVLKKRCHVMMML